jgi:hypothetical protein
MFEVALEVPDLGLEEPPNHDPLLGLLDELADDPNEDWPEALPDLGLLDDPNDDLGLLDDPDDPEEPNDDLGLLDDPEEPKLLRPEEELRPDEPELNELRPLFCPSAVPIPAKTMLAANNNTRNLFIKYP